MDDVLSQADRDYIAENFVTLAAACQTAGVGLDEARSLIEAGKLPEPSYLLDESIEIVPPDYFRLLADAGSIDQLKIHFFARYDAAGGVEREREESWDGYIRGVYGVCLRSVTPETIVAKNRLVDELEHLLAEPRPEAKRWIERLRAAVEALDALERDFSPDYDRRHRFAGPPTRDRLIRSARERYPQVFRHID
jgi:Family of unknown function (DUF6058)